MLRRQNAQLFHDDGSNGKVCGETAHLVQQKLLKSYRPWKLLQKYKCLSKSQWPQAHRLATHILMELIRGRSQLGAQSLAI